MTKEEFIGTPDNWDGHRRLLWTALEITDGAVIELGMGYGSTPQLHQYCKENNRLLLSCDFNLEWAKKFFQLRTPTHYVEHVTDWDTVNLTCGLLFVDHSPGGRRWEDIKRAADISQVIVVHDSEPHEGYQLDRIWPLFKYRLNDQRFPAHTTAISNFIDVSKWEL